MIGMAAFVDFNAFINAEEVVRTGRGWEGRLLKRLLFSESDGSIEKEVDKDEDDVWLFNVESSFGFNMALYSIV